MITRNDIISFIARGKIVDIGCNIGLTFGDRATNVDRYSLEELRKEANDPNLVIPNFVQAHAEDLPFEDLEYDWAVLSELLEHTKDPLLVLNEAQRVAKYVLICVPNEYEWDEQFKPFTHYDHINNFTEPSFKKLIKDSGLILLEFIKLNYAGWAYFISVGASKNFQV